MANYTPTFTKPYPSGWVDKPSKTTPATAAIMNSYDTAIAALEAYLRDNVIDTVTVSVEQFPSDGRQWLGTITVGSNQYKIYIPSLKYENSVSDGTKIGTITLGEQSFDVYAPTSSAGGSTVSVVPKTLTGTNIAEITVDGTTYQLYAPTSGGGSGSAVTAEATLTEGTQIGKITIDGVETILYAPNGGGGSITVDSELSTESENPVQNKVVTTELNKKLETLDDDSQVPDAVNFDLDSELSLTSVKGVQNKAIAEEFQKYADGTKPVAKATEATTAESATKAAQDAQGNVIDTTYAKKTEVPAGTIVDSELSAKSENPVQNKVVKTEFDEINSNLDELGYGENTGSGNLFREEYKNDSLYVKKSQYQSYLKTNIKGIAKLYATVKLKGTSQSNYSCSIGNTDILADKIFLNYGNISIQEYDFGFDDDVYIQIGCSSGVDVNTFFENYEIIISDSIITSDTQYKPYIPSVKMLADENAQQNNSLSVLGKCKNLLNPTLQTTTKNGITCTNNGDGTYTFNGTNSSNKNTTFTVFLTINYTGKTKLLGCPANDNVAMFQSQYDGNWANSKYWDKGNGCIMENASKIGAVSIVIYGGKTVNNLVFKPMLTNNLNATYDDFVPYTGDRDTLTADVATLNSDLSDIKNGTTPVAKAVADEDGNNIKNTYVKKTETSETATEDVNVVLNSDLFDSTYSDITCVRIGKLCVLSFTICAKNTISSTIDKIVLMSIVGEKYQPKKISAGGRRQIFQGFAVGNYDENGKQSQSLNNTVRIITDWDSNYTEIITRDKDSLNWNGYAQGQIMWVTD